MAIQRVPAENDVPYAHAQDLSRIRLAAIIVR
jgi:hypothetical protein